MFKGLHRKRIKLLKKIGGSQKFWYNRGEQFRRNEGGTMDRKTRYKQQRAHKARNKRVIIGGIFLFAIAGIVLFAGYTYYAAKNSVDKMFKESAVISSNKSKEDTSLKASDVNSKFGILLMGVDNDAEREKTEHLDSARTDSLIYMVYDGENKKIDMVSLPRDIWTNIYDGTGTGTIATTAKINSAFTIGEEDATIETVQNYLQLPIDYYVNINFTSFEKIIDAIGGITVDVPYDINKKYTSDNTGETLIPEGRQLLNGEQALIFARIRKMDTDVDRGNRQQEVIEAAIHQALKINNVTKYQEILDSVSEDVNTNFKFEDLVSLAGNMLSGFDIQKHTFEWYDGESYDGQSIVYIQDYSYNEIRNDMLKALGQAPADSQADANTETQTGVGNETGAGTGDGYGSDVVDDGTGY
ncbi:cell envelope-like function transcriptional attenuator common domain protein [Enterococcus casseliflavus ATCC 12755]|uniref:Cell envelope-like function transcriptional attenuator common domain protein n=2 Tax=Enterococcus casseliflavus TaxID=37734 RepID=F0EKA0_ENTCA|nr:cell envelope-like function transcriptional attenuator common domain protein [Enterococcus casseliflavus ATCC 12755]